MNIKKIHIFLFFALINLSLSSQTTWTTQIYNPDVVGIENNPMKGWMPGYTGINSTFPYSVDHFYINLKSTYINWNTYDWTTFDNNLNRIVSKGCHAVVRFWIDYPTQVYGMPTFLQSVVPASDYTVMGNLVGQSKIPEWNNETLMTALEQFIAAFGARYNGDPRIAMIEAGLYGFWGEWHTFGMKGYEMNQVNKDRLIAAYLKAFPTTHIGLRQSAHASTQYKMSLGYYDDSFAQATLCTGSWCFWNGNIVKDGITNFYQFHPIGGELRPEIQNNIFDEWPNATFSTEDNMAMEDLQTCINTTHLSFMKAFYLYSNTTVTPTEKINALKAHKMMGYKFYVKDVQILPGVSRNFTVNLNLQNRGVAPLYYNWQVEFSAINTVTNQWTGVIGTADWNMNTVMPNSSNYLKSFTGKLSTSDNYKILMRVKNPLESYTSNARILRFANANQDADRIGWLTLEGWVTTSTDIINDKDRSISVYPNPVSDILNLSHYQGATIRIYDITGVLQFTKRSTNTSTSIDVTKFKQNGILLAHVISGNQTKVLKIICNK